MTKALEISRRRRHFRVSVTLPDGVNMIDARDYIADAVRSWCKQFRPPLSTAVDDKGDPRWTLGDKSAVVVMRQPRKGKNQHDA